MSLNSSDYADIINRLHNDPTSASVLADMLEENGDGFLGLLTRIQAQCDNYLVSIGFPLVDNMEALSTRVKKGCCIPWSKQKGNCAIWVKDQTNSYFRKNLWHSYKTGYRWTSHPTKVTKTLKPENIPVDVMKVITMFTAIIQASKYIQI